MANGKIRFGKQSGGQLTLVIPDGVTSTDLVLPESGTVASVSGVVTDNAIVRFDGETGKVQTSNIAIDDSGNIGSGTQSFNGFGGSGFKNYIINGNFGIWQRGTSFSAVGYCADRWYLAIGGSVNAMKHNINPNTILVSTTADSSFANLHHAIETATVIGLRGKTLTLSLKLQTNGTHTGRFALTARYSNSTDAFTSQTTTIQALGVSASSTNTRYSLTFTVPADAVGLRIDIENISAESSGALYQVQEVQLEEGSVATPFEQRPYGLELSLCQRYYQRGFQNRGVSNAYSIGNVSLRIPFHTSMRVIPTISQVQGTTLNLAIEVIGVGTVTPTSMVFEGARPNALQVDFASTSLGSQANIATLAQDIIQCSAEL